MWHRIRQAPESAEQRAPHDCTTQLEMMPATCFRHNTRGASRPLHAFAADTLYRRPSGILTPVVYTAAVDRRGLWISKLVTDGSRHRWWGRPPDFRTR